MTKRIKWNLKEIDTEYALRISEELNISYLAAKILCARGYKREDIIEFLNNASSLFYDPFLLGDMKKATDRIKDAISRKEKIAIYGDYDVDGITSTFVLYDYLKNKGTDVIYYIPDRIQEGYGINTDAIDKLHAEGTNLIITVDVGITAFNEVQYANSLGIDLIVTDHHSLKETLPEAVAVINPKIPGTSYPFDSLAGVGVAFKLLYALSGMDDKVFEKYCDIVAVGTIADMVPLKDENRYIVLKGIEKLKNTDNHGIKAIAQLAGLDLSDVCSTDISFGIAPRLNAAGRMSDASKSVELLLEKNPSAALTKAEMLDSFNRQRQSEELAIFEEAVEIIKNNKYDKDNFILVAKEGWANGVIGIVSSKLTEKYYKPSAVVSINPDGTGKASGRSIKGINIFDALMTCSDNLVKFGGHELAAGFTIKDGEIDDFRANMNNHLSSFVTDEIFTASVNVDCSIELGDISLENAYSLEILEPHGIENPTPTLAIFDLRIVSIRFTQNKKHAFITVTDGKSNRELPAFSMIDKVKTFHVGDYINVIGNLGINSFKGKTHSQFIIRDIKFSEMNNYISRPELAMIFNDIRSKITKGINVFDKRVTLSVSQRKKSEITSPKIQTALKIFDELKILSTSEVNDGYLISEGVNFKIKSNLNNSSTFQKYNSEGLS